MIFYFSGTGNSAYVARRIAAATGETMVSISECVRTGKFSFKLEEGEKLGFVHPVFFYGLPKIVLEFLRKARFSAEKQPYLFHVMTIGGSTGAAGRGFNAEMSSKGLTVNATFSVVMPDTWTPMFDLSDAAKNQRVLDKAQPVIADIVAKVSASAKGDFNRRKGFWTLFSSMTYKAYQKLETDKFMVTDACVGCGLCARQCPDNAIEIKDGKPVWTTKHCNFCLGCLHKCPQFAIQFGKNTAKHGQWHLEQPF